MRLRLAALAALLTLLATCGSGEVAGRASRSGPSVTRSAKRTTCREVQVSDAPKDLHPVDRRLRSFSPGLSGVEVTYGGTVGRSILVLSGGYPDDVTEPYDDLEPTGTITIDRTPWQVLGGEFRQHPVRVVIWGKSGLTPPCGNRAIVTVGLSDQEFERVVHGSS